MAKINNNNSVVDDGCDDNDDDHGDGDDDDDDGDDDNNNDNDDADDDNECEVHGYYKVMGFYIAVAPFHHEGSQTQSWRNLHYEMC